MQQGGNPFETRRLRQACRCLEVPQTPRPTPSIPLSSCVPPPAVHACRALAETPNVMCWGSIYADDPSLRAPDYVQAAVAAGTLKDLVAGFSGYMCAHFTNGSVRCVRYRGGAGLLVFLAAARFSRWMAAGAVPGAGCVGWWGCGA